MLIIVDYGVGNLVSIQNMLKKGGYRDARISAKPEDILSAEKLILPGVGHFDYGMKSLRCSGLFNALNQRVIENQVPILGICLGAQLLTRSSEEGTEPGLGWIDAETVRFDEARMPTEFKVPHMGWSDVSVLKDSGLFRGLHEESRFYFVHTYHMLCESAEDGLVEANYGYPFTAGIERHNVMGVQFHPEKSHKFGLKLLSNFVEEY